MKCLLDAIKDAPNEVAMMSRLNCHAENISSIVVQNTGGKLLRAFLAWTGHPLDRNWLGSTLPVGVHDHRYSISLCGIFGHVFNDVYFRDPMGVRLNEWAFTSGEMTSVPKVELIGADRVSLGSCTLLNDDWINMSAGCLHTIRVSGHSAWWVQEGAISKLTTTLFTKADRVSSEGLYLPFRSKGDVVDHVTKFFGALNEL